MVVCLWVLMVTALTVSIQCQCFIRLQRSRLMQARTPFPHPLPVGVAHFYGDPHVSQRLAATNSVILTESSSVEVVILVVMSICTWNGQRASWHIFMLIRWTKRGPGIGSIQPLLAESLEPTQVIFTLVPLALFYQESILSSGRAPCVAVRSLLALGTAACDALCMNLHGDLFSNFDFTPVLFPESLWQKCSRRPEGCVFN